MRGAVEDEHVRDAKMERVGPPCWNCRRCHRRRVVRHGAAQDYVGAGGADASAGMNATGSGARPDQPSVLPITPTRCPSRFMSSVVISGAFAIPLLTNQEIG